MCNRSFARFVALLGVVAAVGSALLGWTLLENIVKEKITENVVLTENSTSFPTWQKLPEQEFKVYIMEVENADDVALKGAKPKMKETGPYVYLVHKEKENVMFSEDGNFVEYEQRSHYVFSPELSGNLTEDDEVTVLNSALLGLFYAPLLIEEPFGIDAMESSYPFLIGYVDSIFLKISVRKLLFEGIQITCDKDVLEGIYFEKEICSFMKVFHNSGKLTPFFRYDEDDGNFYYSLFSHKSDKTDGHFKVMTGKSDVSKIGQIVEWNDKPTLKFWSGPECNAMQGSDATIFPPFMNKESKISVYSTDICRSLYMTFDKEIKYKGVDGYRYVVDSAQFDNVSTRAENYCYCASVGACVREGVMDLMDCYNAPVIASLPHFLDAPFYEQMVDNLHPDREKHQMYLDAEPNSGFPLTAGRRVQFNMLIKPLSYYSLTANLSTAVLPLVWIDESLHLDDNNVKLLKDKLVQQLNMVDMVRWGLLVGGCVLFVLGSICFIHSYGNPKKPARETEMKAL